MSMSMPTEKQEKNRTGIFVGDFGDVQLLLLLLPIKTCFLNGPTPLQILQQIGM